MIGLPGKRPLAASRPVQKIALNLFIFFAIGATHFILTVVCASRWRIDSVAAGKWLQSLHLASPSAEITDEN